MSPSRCKAGVSCICKGMSLVERFKHFDKELHDLQHGNPQKRKQVLSNAHPCLVQLICEIGLNILKGNIDLPERQYENLKPLTSGCCYVCADLEKH